MAQVPGCGCGTGGTGGGGDCANVVVSCFCAADDFRPILSRTVVLCNGTIQQSMSEMDGTPYVGDVVQCPDADAVQGAPGGIQFCYEEDTSFSTTSAVPATWFSVTPGLPTGTYGILLNVEYNVTNNSTQVGVDVAVNGVTEDGFQAGSLGSTDVDIRQPGTVFFCLPLTDTDTIEVDISRPKGSGTAQVFDAHIGIWAVA